MADNPFTKIWGAAIRRYETDTKMSLADAMPDLAGALTANRLLGIIDDEHGKFKNYRSRGEKVRNAMKPVLVLVELFADVAGEGVTNVFQPGKAVFAAVKYLLNAARNISSRYDAIVDIFLQTHSFLNRLCIYLDGTISATLQERLVKILAHMLSLFGLVTKYIQKGRLKLFVQNVFSKNDDIQDALQRLDHLTKEEILIIQAETHQVTQKTYKTLEQAQVDEELQKCLAWLSAPDPYVNYNAAQEKLYNHKTGQWILQNTHFNAWMQGSHSSFWLYGRPGTGKSVLCSTIIKSLLQDCKSKNSSTVAFFYFDFNDSAKQIFRNLLGSTLGQLSSQSSDAASVLKVLYAEHDSGHKQPSLSSLQHALKNILKLSGTVYLVLDALDECLEDERHRYLFPFVEDLMLDNSCPVHLLAASRNETDIRDCLMTKVSHTLDLSSILNYNDITWHLSTVLHEDRFFSTLHSDIKTEIHNTLSEGANGM
ncbi:hypothetical protein EVG20_g2664 [Dentipellis fragilis]|uniref:NACHT domain-containing protein n=1 Tax=Dentipellis fragilis TaxID=205917 RepID=A0A4Y9Z756_9AGAM|nr:hypothetical protein EVG20_g2664 [Dentipellis fragilis]